MPTTLNAVTGQRRGKRRRPGCGRIPAALAALLVLIAPAWGQGNRKLSGHVPPIVQRLQPLGRLAGTNRLSLAIGLPVRDRQGLTNLLHQLYDPRSPQYRHYLKPRQFTERFGPTEQAYKTVVDFAKARGFTVKGTHPNRLLLDVSGAVSDIESAFHLNLHVYKHPVEARTFIAPDAEPSVPADVPILDISGLDDYMPPRPVGHTRSPPHGPGATPLGGSGPGGGYAGGDFRAAYAPGVTLTGAGQILALVEYEGYYAQDILAYEASNSLPNVPLTNVLVDGSSGVPGYGIGSNGISEVSLDIEMAIAMAPGLAGVIVYEGYAYNGGYPVQLANDVLSQIANDDLAQQISCSWVWSGAGSFYYHSGRVDGDAVIDELFQQMAAQGQSFFQASGDTGAYWDDQGGYATDQWDAGLLTSPYITLVGGTSLTTGPGGAWGSEVVWNQVTNDVSSSGAISSTYPIPPWQQGVDMSRNGGSTTKRNTPDVAMVAQNIFSIYNNGQLDLSGWGTSCAAPLWAGFAALINEQAAINEEPPVGFINPAIYAICLGTNFAFCFHDITSGNNSNSYCPTNFFAGPGYDLCTGWGTPSGSNLINALAPPSDLRVAPSAGFTTANGPAGGPFNITSQTFTLTNAGSLPLNWSVGNTSIWLSASPSSGTLSPGGPAAIVTVSLNSAAGTLSVGVYTASVWFSNLNNGYALSRQFELLAGQPLVQNGGFATGDFSGWILSGAVGQDGAGNFAIFGLLGPSESNAGYIDFREGVNVPVLSQSLPTVPGQAYLLSFWYNDTDSQDSCSVYCGNVEIDLGPSQIWTNAEAIVIATNTVTPLQFWVSVDAALGDISVTPIPATVLRVSVPATNALGLSWNAVTGLTYQLQYNTNLTQTNWVNLGGSATATNAVMSASDIIGPDPQRFYRVVLLP